MTTEESIKQVTKQCTKCKEIMPFEYPIFPKDGRGGLKSYCRLCGNKMSNAYKAKNRSKMNAYNKVYKAEHKEEISEYNKEYHVENRDDIQERVKNNRKERLETDSNFKIRCNVGSKLTYHLRQISNPKNSKKYYDLLACTGKFFTTWIEFQDEEGDFMWEDRTNWHIDHVNPCCNFDLTNDDELKKCFHWSNYQPLSKEDNFSIFGKVDNNLIKAHKIKASKFIEEFGNHFNKNDYTNI